MTSRKPAQGSIVARLDGAIAELIEQGHAPRAIYLTNRDYKLLAAVATRVHRSQTGSTAFLWPLSHGDVPIVNDKGADEIELPVRRSLPEPRQSVVYAAGGYKVVVL